MANITITTKRIVDLPEAAYGKGFSADVYGGSKGSGGAPVDMTPYALLAGRPDDILHIDEIRKFTTDSTVTGLDIEGVNFLDNVIQIDPTLSSNPGYLDFVGNVDIRADATKVFTYDDPVAGVVRIGEGAGNDSMTQQDAILIGVNAGNALTSGLGSIFVGAHVGEFSTESFNVGIGHYALSSITDAVQTVAVGAYSFASITNLYNNTGLGHYSGRWNTGQQNTFVGSYTGYGVDQSAGSPASGNVGLGYNSLLSLTSGDYNIAIGWAAASILETGNYNVIIGYAGSVTADQSYRLYLTPLIEGNYASGSEYLVSVYEFRVNNITENNSGVGVTINDEVYLPDIIAQTDETDVVYFDSGTGELSYGAAGGVGHWTRTGTVLDTKIAGDQVRIGQTSGGYLDFTGHVDIRDDGDSRIVMDYPLPSQIRIGNNAGNDTMTSTYAILIGVHAGNALTSGTYPVLIGGGAGQVITDAIYPTAIGYHSQWKNITGDRQLTIGMDSLEWGTGTENTALGAFAMRYQYLGSYNMVIGGFAMYGVVNQTGNQSDYNTAIGRDAMRFANGALGNIAIGYRAGYGVTSGDYNTFIGRNTGLTAGITGTGNMLIGDNLNLSSPSVNYELNIGKVLRGGMGAGVEWMGTPYEIRTDTLTEYTTDAGITFSDATYLTGILENATETYVVAIDNSTGLLSKRTVASIGGGGYSAGEGIDISSAGVIDVYLQTTKPGLEFDSNGSMGVIFGTTAGTVAEGDQLYWDRAGTVIAPKVAGDQVQIDSTNSGYLTYTGDVDIRRGSAKIIYWNNNYHTLTLGGSVLNDSHTSASSVYIGYNSAGAMTTGDMNIVIGVNSATAMSTASYNTIIGYNAFVAGDGNFNMVMGYYAGTNITSTSNVAIGYYAMSDAGATTSSVAIGSSALRYLSGTHNIGIGNNAGVGAVTVSTGDYNVFIGSQTGQDIEGGDHNFGAGYQSLYSVTSGSNNVALGSYSGQRITTLWQNTLVGAYAGQQGTGYGNTFIGYQTGMGVYSSTTGNNNTFIGWSTGSTYTTGSNNVLIGYNVELTTVSDSNVFKVGSGATIILEGNFGGSSEYIGSAYEFRTDLITEYTSSNGVEFDVPILLTGLSAQSTETDVLYRNSSTGEITFGAVSGGMVYPGAGIALSTGSAWGTSITDNSSTWNAAQPGHANLTSLAGLSYASVSFVKMTAANTFALDTNTYSQTGHTHLIADVTDFTDNSTNWNTAYTHSQVTTGNPHQVDWSELQGTQPAPVSHNHTYSEITDFASGVSANETSHTNVVVDGDFVAEGIMLRGATSGVYSILANNSANWNTAYNHSQVSSGNPHSVTYAELGGSLPGHATSHESGGGDTINHDSLVGFLTTEHFLQSAISIPASQISDFDTEVSNNSDVASNTGARHVAATILDTTTINFGLSGQQITGSAIYQMTVTADSSGLKLINDVNTPTAAQYYGSAPASTTKGWYDLPSGGTGYWEKNSTYVSLVTNTDWVAIGTDTPSMKLHVYGTASTDKIQTDIGLNFYQVPEPTGLSAALLSGTALGIGLYYYLVTYTTALGETRYNYTSITTTSGNQSVRLTVPVSSDYRVTGRKIYRTKVGGSLYNDYYLATIANNTTTTYDDTIADSSLPDPASASYFRDNTTNQMIRVNGTPAMQIGFNSCIMGINAGEDVTTAGRMALYGTNSGRNITTARDNQFFGYASGYYTTTGSNNTAMGAYVFNDNVDGSYNSSFGYASLSNTISGSYNVAFGAMALQGVHGTTTGYASAFGAEAGRYSTGYYNVFVGSRAGLGVSGSSTGQRNIFIGRSAGDEFLAADYNILIGYDVQLPTNTTDYYFGIGYITTMILEGSTDSGNEWIGSEYEFRTDLITEYTSSAGVEIDKPLTLSGLASSTSSYVLYYNAGLITQGLAPTGGTSDGFLDGVTVNSINDVDFSMTTASDVTAIDFGHDFTEHDNVTLTSLATDDIMKWSGSAWVNVPIPTGGGGGVYVTGTPADSYIAVWTNATTIEGTSSFLFDSGIKITSPTNTALDILVSDTNTNIWRIGNSTGYGFYDYYHGEGIGNLNALRHYSENQTGTDIMYASITQDGVWSFHVTPKIGAIAELSSGAGTTMQHKLYFTGLTEVTTNYVLYYNDLSGLITWDAKPSGGGDDGVLSGVNASTITAVDFTITGAADVLDVDFGHNISVHDDVDFTSLASTQIMQWNGSNWVNVAIPSGGGEDGYLSAVNASDIYNVDFTMVNTSDVLNVDFGHLLTKHDNVVITSLVSGQILEYNGANWVNITTPSGGGGGTVTNVGAGNGMNFSDIVSTGDVVLRTPTVNLSGTSTNAVNSSGHTHAITTVAVVNSGTGLADGNQIYDFVIGRGYTTNTGTVTQVNHGVGMNFSDFSTSGTITLGTPSVNLSATSANSVSGTTHSHAITTAAVVNGGTHFADGNQIYDFVTTRGYIGTPADNILDWSSNSYRPYTSRSAGRFYTGTTPAVSTNRLNYDGYFYATYLYAGGKVVAGLGTTFVTLGEQYIQITTASSVKTYLHPSVTNGATAIAYDLDTSNTLSTAGAKIMSVSNNGTERFYVDYAGKTWADDDSYADDFVQNSDPKLKNVHGSIINGLDLALLLNPVYFDWKNGKKGGREQIGFLSTDVGMIHDSLVTKGLNGFDAVSYGKISVINNAAIHQLNKKVETNEEKIIRLEEKVEQLEEQLNGST